jgi:S-formylglutathione hydrolase FrmB
VAVVVAVVAACGASGAPKAQMQGAQAFHTTIASRAVGRTLGLSVVVPSGAGDGRPLVVFLHGRGGDENTEVGNGAMYAGLAAAGAAAPVIAFPYGGNHSYWHNRRDGRWADYVLREVIPAVTKRFHTDPRRVAIGGISMGGFGAFDMARLHPRRFCAAGGHSPALWESSGQTAPGAFDDRSDFARHDVVGAARRSPGSFAGTRLWLDAGAADPFQPGDRALLAAFRAAHVPVQARVTARGGHDGSYWRAHWREYVGFYADALAKCTPAAGG